MFDDFFEDAMPSLDRKEAFRILNAVIAKRSTLPVIMAVKVTGEGGYLTFEGTDLDIGAKIRTPNFLDFQGVAVVGWKTFKAQAGLIPVAKMDGFMVEDYPCLPKPEGKDIGTQWLEDGRKVLYAVSDDATRLSLNGVYVHEDGCVATDGHRLHLVPGAYDCRAIVPPKVFKVCRDKPSECLVSERTVALVYPWGHIVSKLLEGPYPNYRQVVPKDFYGYKVLSVSSKTLLDACDKAKELRKEIPKVYLHSGVLEVEGAAGEWFKIQDVKMPEGFEIQYDARYLPDTLKGLGPTANISVKSPVQATLFNRLESEETRILMPLRPAPKKDT